jgi:3-methyladenine DNA glycosylase AlkD
MEPLADTIRAELMVVRVPADAPAMKRYMKDRFEFIGVKTPARRAVSTPLIKPLRHDPQAAVEVVDALWAMPERELHYVAADLVGLVAPALDGGHLDWLRGLVTTNCWWDTVDSLAVHGVGAVVRDRPELWTEVDGWANYGPHDERMWLARTAIIHQLGYRERTNSEVLFDRCVRRSHDHEFFIRKAIGWALRDYARTDPAGVRTFVDIHRSQLSPLSIREATKHL